MHFSFGNVFLKLVSVFRLVRPKTQNRLDKPVCFTHATVLLSYVHETSISLETCLSSRFMSIVLWPRTTRLVPVSS